MEQFACRLLHLVSVGVSMYSVFQKLEQQRVHPWSTTDIREMGMVWCPVSRLNWGRNEGMSGEI